MNDILPQWWDTDLLTCLYGRPVEFVLVIRELIPWAFPIVVAWHVGVGGAGLAWKFAVLDEDIELRPVGKPILVQTWPKP